MASSGLPGSTAKGPPAPAREAMKRSLSSGAMAKPGWWGCHQHLAAASASWASWSACAPPRPRSTLPPHPTASWEPS